MCPTEACSIRDTERPESQSVLSISGDPTTHSHSLPPTLETAFSQDCSSHSRGKAWPPGRLTHSHSLQKALDPSISLYLMCSSHCLHITYTVCAAIPAELDHQWWQTLTLKDLHDLIHSIAQSCVPTWAQCLLVEETKAFKS